MALEPGTEAPDFTLKDQDGNDVTLSSFRGDKAVTLVFYPFTFTGVCEAELCSLRDDLGRYEAADVQVLAISCDSKHSQRVWSEQQGFGFPVLSDFWPHGATAQAYGVFDQALGCAVRTTFLVDRAGVVVDTFGTEGLGTPREAERYAEALARL